MPKQTSSDLLDPRCLAFLVRGLRRTADVADVPQTEPDRLTHLLKSWGFVGDLSAEPQKKKQNRYDGRPPGCPCRAGRNGPSTAWPTPPRAARPCLPMGLDEPGAADRLV